MTYDGLAGLRQVLKRTAVKRGEWAGIPMPLESHKLILEPSYPYAELGEMYSRGRETSEEASTYADWKERNRFWSVLRSSTIVVLEKPNGRITYGQEAGVHHLTQDVETLGASDAWGEEQEDTALELLRSLVKRRQFKQYRLTGMFLESSPRSGVTYLFRRLKPTVALRPHPDTERGMKILAALCMHPIGYYTGSWAGSMCPTDDVIAHLMLMRGDEALFWRRCQQHAPWTAEAGL